MSRSWSAPPPTSSVRRRGHHDLLRHPRSRPDRTHGQTHRPRRGGIDVLVNNAGIIQVGPLEHMTIDDFEEAMETHFWGPLFTSWRRCRTCARGGEADRQHLVDRRQNCGAAPGALLRQQVRAGRSFRWPARGAGRPGLRGHDRLPRPDAHRLDLQREVQGPHRHEFAWFHCRTPSPASRCRRRGRRAGSSTPAGTASRARC